jgi:hypothetical protein
LGCAQLGYQDRLYAIAYGNGQFVVTLLDRAGILTSTDGVNWVQRQSATTNSLYGIVYGNGQFVAVGGPTPGDGTNFVETILTSADGVNWVDRLSGTQDSLTGIGYGNG